MEKTYKLNLNMWALATDGNHILHKIDNVDYPVIRRTIVKAEDIDRWEELTVAEWEERKQAQERAEKYAGMLAAAVHERYSVDDEIALRANIDAPELAADEEKASAVAEEWAAYQAYRAECKERVRRELDMEN